MTSSYVSSWSIAALTLERYLAIAHPLKHVQYGHISRWKTMACWLPLPFLLNLVQFYSLSPPADPGLPVRKCEVKDGQVQASDAIDQFQFQCPPLLVSDDCRTVGCASLLCAALLHCCCPESGDCLKSAFSRSQICHAVAATEEAVSPVLLQSLPYTDWFFLGQMLGWVVAIAQSVQQVDASAGHSQKRWGLVKWHEMLV